MGPMNHIRRRRVARFPGQSKSSNDTRRHGKLAKSLPIQWMRNRPSNLLKLAGFQISAGAFPFRTEPYAWTALESFSFPDLGTCTRIIRRRDWIPSTCSWQMEWSALATWVQTLILSFRSETASTVANCLDPRSLRRDRSSTMPHQTGRFGGAFRTLRTRGKRSETSIDMASISSKCTTIRRDAFFAIADEGAKLGLPFAGHVPIDVTVEEAADSRIKSIEHLANFRVFRDCSGNEPYSGVRCRSLFERLAARGVWETPTITFSELIPDLFVGKPLPHVEYASDSLLELTRKNAEASKLDEQELVFFRSNSRTSLVAIRDLFASGNHF